jgi:transcription antitermination factor NusG
MISFGPHEKLWFAARTRRNQERQIKSRLEQIGVEHFIPFRKEFRRRKDRVVELSVPVIPNIVFIYSDYSTSLSTINDYGIRISYLSAIDGRGRLVVPPKQMDDFKLICQSNILYNVSAPEPLARGDRVVVVAGSLTGLEGELVHTAHNNGRVIVKLDHIASFELTISADSLRKIK